MIVVPVSDGFSETRSPLKPGRLLENERNPVQTARLHERLSFSDWRMGVNTRLAHQLPF